MKRAIVVGGMLVAAVALAVVGDAGGRPILDGNRPPPFTVTSTPASTTTTTPGNVAVAESPTPIVPIPTELSPGHLIPLAVPGAVRITPIPLAGVSRPHVP